LDAFTRYLSEPANQTVTPSQTNNDRRFAETQDATPPDRVTDERSEMPLSLGQCDGVTVGDDLEDEEEAWTV
jgi:hypothetical protein